MTAVDGRVRGVTKIVDAGPASKRWNLVLTSDGYRAEEMDRFAADVQSLTDYLFTAAPFDDPTLRRAINIFRLDVESNQSGADKPICPDGGGTGATAATYFDGTFCYDGRTERLLYGDDRLAISTVKTWVPKWHQILILVNDTQRGGGGGDVGWFSTSSGDWRDVAIHGNGPFGLRSGRRI